MWASPLATVSAATYAGWAFGLVASLVGAVGWLGGSYRKSVAEARDKDIAALLAHSQLQDTQIADLQLAVQACEARDEAKALVIANLSSQIQAADKLDAVAHGVAELLSRTETKP